MLIVIGAIGCVDNQSVAENGARNGEFAFCRMPSSALSDTLPSSKIDCANWNAQINIAFFSTCTILQRDSMSLGCFQGDGAWDLIWAMPA